MSAATYWKRDRPPGSRWLPGQQPVGGPVNRLLLVEVSGFHKKLVRLRVVRRRISVRGLTEMAGT
jgi:hypothetical protein